MSGIEHEPEHVDVQTIRLKGTSSSFDLDESSSSSAHPHIHGAVHMVGANPTAQPPLQTTVAEIERKRGRFGYLRTMRFWFVLGLSQMLAIANTGTSTLTTFLNMKGAINPAFQSLLTYVLLTLIYSSMTISRYGVHGWLRVLFKDGWRYFLLAFCDVQGNYFTVYAYQYTTILSAQLINFWAIAVVVFVSLVFLKVRYHVAQYIGILICCGGLGILVASDHITGSNGGPAADAVKGDLFALVGATGYGLANVFEEFLVSKRPIYEVLGQLSFWGMIIIGVQGAIFNRADYANYVWDNKVGGYLAGYTLILTWFYSSAPLIFRMASAAFFNIGLLTGNFWGVIIGTKVFGYHIHYLYPIAFCLIMIGHFIYYGTEGILGEAKKPWLGENQEGGDDGVGTARRQLESPSAIV